MQSSTKGGWSARAWKPLCDSPDLNGQASATSPSSSSVSGGVLFGMNMVDETAIKGPVVLLARYFTNYVLYFSSRRFSLKKKKKHFLGSFSPVPPNGPPDGQGIYIYETSK